MISRNVNPIVLPRGSQSPMAKLGHVHRPAPVFHSLFTNTNMGDDRCKSLNCDKVPKSSKNEIKSTITPSAVYSMVMPATFTCV